MIWKTRSTAGRNDNEESDFDSNHLKRDAMENSETRDVFWGYWANIFYIFGMCGYLTMDTLIYLEASIETRLISFVYTFLAIILLIDAILYSIDWYTYAVKSRDNLDQPIHFRSEFIACIFHYLGSFGYLIGSLTAFNRTDLFNAFLLWNFLGSLAFLFESAFTFLGWIITLKRLKISKSKHGCNSQNVLLWAHLFNIIAGIVYLSSTSLAYRFYQHYRSRTSNAVLILQMFGDLLYLFDAYLYYDSWQRESVSNREHDQLIELRLSKQLVMDEIDKDTTVSDLK